MNRQLRIKISWNLYESELVSRYLPCGMYDVNRSSEYNEDELIAKYSEHVPSYLQSFINRSSEYVEDERIAMYSEHVPSYLQSVINRSSENCFSDEDKRIRSPS